MRRVMFVLPLLLAACSTTKGSMSDSAATKAKSQFDVMTSLAGEWSGTAMHGDQPMPIVVTYHVTANGSAVEETLFKGTDHEMVSMYYVDGDRLVLTHYCVMGNQPHLAATPTSDPHTIAFGFVSASNMQSKNDVHMHEMTLVVRDKNHIESTWEGWKDGKPDHAAHFELTRRVATAMTTVHFDPF